MTRVRAHVDRFASAARLDDTTDVHVPKRPGGRTARPAGVALGCRPGLGGPGRLVRGDTAMSGGLTLAGTVGPVAGIREKVLGACRDGMRAVILPSANETDIAESFGGRVAVRHQRAPRDGDG